MSATDFLLIRPLAVTDAILTSSNVPEATVSEYAGGTTYAAGAQAGVTTGTAQIVYESLQAGNVGHTPASSPTWWKALGTVYAAYNGATTYALNDIVSSISTDVHELYQSLTAGNVGHALTDTTKWLSLGKTARWKMFDQAYNSQAERTDTIVVVLTPGEIINALALLNVEAASVTVTQSASAYSETVSLASHPVLTWYDWFFEEVLRTGDVVFPEIPPFATGTLTVTIDNTGGTARIGCCIPGKSRRLGMTLTDAARTINDYSVTAEDAFGNVTLVQRSYSKRLNVEFKVDDGLESEVTRMLEMYRATPVVFVGSDSYAMTIIYGFLGQWEVPISGTGKPATLQIKGLI